MGEKMGVRKSCNLPRIVRKVKEAGVQNPVALDVRISGL